MFDITSGVGRTYLVKHLPAHSINTDIITVGKHIKTACNSISNIHGVCTSVVAS